ncbi:hypothetical protein SCLCIDRAFT_81591, partial [Scleroderma citrinum Foug A]
YLSIILECEYPTLAEECQVCHQATADIQCLSCQTNYTWCGPCAVKSHIHNPFHQIQKWTGRFYDDITLHDLGYVFNLGHNGAPCPNNMAEHGGDWFCDQFTIVHSTGIFIHRLRWCRCNDASLEDQHLQLLQSHIFPSTVTKPQTGFTFDVLEHFLINSLECKTSARSFYQKLCQFSNNAFPDSLPDCYWELLRVSQIWRDLSNRKRAGFGHDIERYPEHGELAVFCPACPQ